MRVSHPESAFYKAEGGVIVVTTLNEDGRPACRAGILHDSAVLRPISRPFPW